MQNPAALPRHLDSSLLCMLRALQTDSSSLCVLRALQTYLLPLDSILVEFWVRWKIR